MLNVSEICLNTTNYPIFNMEDFIIFTCAHLFWTVLVRWYPHSDEHVTSIAKPAARFGADNMADSATGETPEETTEQFTAYLMSSVHQGCVAGGVALGVNLGLFECLDRFEQPATYQEIAQKADYRERLVQNPRF